MTDKDLLTVEEVARRLRVHPRTVRDWAHDRMIPCVLLEGTARNRYRFTEAQYKQIVRSRVQQPLRVYAKDQAA